MKLRVLRNSLRGARLAAVLGGGVLGLLFALLTLLLGTVTFDRPEASVEILATGYAAWLVGWVLAPIATGGGDDTLRPEHFSLLPIGRARLATGLLVAGFAGVPAVVTLVAFGSLPLYGARFGAGPALLGLGFAVALLGLVVLVYRVVMTALAGLLGSRRGKELGILLVGVLGLAGVGVNYALGTVIPTLVEGRAGEFAAVMTALPTGWGPVAVRAAGTGEWGLAAGLSLAMVAMLAALVLGWGALLTRQVTATGYRGSARRRAGERRAGRSLLPATPVGAVVGKELRTWWRDARRRVALLTTPVLGLVVAVVPTLGEGGDASSVLAYLGVFVVALACVQTGNLYGFDGSALWHTLLVPGAERPDVRGRQLAWALLVGGPSLLFALVLPGVTGHPEAYPRVLALVPAVAGAGSGIVLLQSVFAAYPLPDPRHHANPFSSGGRPGCARILLILALTLLLVLAAAPAVAALVAGGLLGSPVLTWLAVPIGLATGSALAWWWGGLAVRRLARQGPELLATVGADR
ncbi:ABC-2 type transport system permease protein [Prauserella shujinwangii]|uniref:ABC-2 type transport system permease protein n=2 Tax=Prauserella shujinwangii TaxID=1453103 RepID=A0A2T0M186_9PSEU|nr:ABC-2 type transport system permease protein [Prauserella shujinwangii]